MNQTEKENIKNIAMVVCIILLFFGGFFYILSWVLDNGPNATYIIKDNGPDRLVIKDIKKINIAYDTYGRTHIHYTTKTNEKGELIDRNLIIEQIPQVENNRE
jgi:hypothetical protein